MTVDLGTRYLGLELRSPIIASASPLTRDPEMTTKLEAAGAGAIVMPSLFEEEIENEEVELSASLEAGTEGFAEALDYFPEVDTFIGEGDRYLRTLERIKGKAHIPVIGSLNANSVGGWVRYARLMADAGADALELNLYRISVDRTRTSVDIEEEDLELIAAVRAAVNLPLAVKLSPFYTALANFAGKAVEAGANGLVLFNRFYQPDIDLDELAVVPRVSLSHPTELRLPMRWTAILRPQLGPEVGIAATSGHPQRQGRHQGRHGRGGRGGHGLRAAARRARQDRRRRGGDAGVARGERVHLGRPAARQRQPGQGE